MPFFQESRKQVGPEGSINYNQQRKYIKSWTKYSWQNRLQVQRTQRALTIQAKFKLVALVERFT